MAKAKQSRTFNTPSGKHPVAKAEIPQAQKIVGEKKSNDPIQAKNEAIAKEKEKSQAKTHVKSNSKLFETQTFQVQETGPLEFITRSVKEHFKLTEVHFKENLIRWDFPKKIGSIREAHTVKRIYPQVKLYIDVFNAKDPQSEIDRIKAHMEALGLKYTYIKGGDAPVDKDGQITEEFKKLLFDTRLKPIDIKTLKTPVRVPKNEEEAGMRPLVVQG
jgi:hypothetical protein